MTKSPDGLAIKFWVPNAPTIFSTAAAAATGISAPLRKGGQTGALVSVVFAAASLEALLNEAAYLAELDLPNAVEPGIISAFVQIMEEAEESKAQTQSKFQLAHLAMTGKAYGKGSAPYQDFSLLIAARNALLHLKSKEYFSSVDGKPAVFNQVALVEKLSSKEYSGRYSSRRGLPYESWFHGPSHCGAHVSRSHRRVREYSVQEFIGCPKGKLDFLDRHESGCGMGV